MIFLQSGSESPLIIDNANLGYWNEAKSLTIYFNDDCTIFEEINYSRTNKSIGTIAINITDSFEKKEQCKKSSKATSIKVKQVYEGKSADNPYLNFLENFLDNNAQLLGLHIEDNCPVINTPLRQLTDLFSTLRVIVVGVRRQGVLFAPSAGDQLFCADEVYLMCHSSDASRTMDVFGKSPGEQNRIILIGGGGVVTHLLIILPNLDLV